MLLIIQIINFLGCDGLCGGGQDMQSSFADSGHFEDMTTNTTISSIHSSKDKINKLTRDQACSTECEISSQRDGERKRLMELYERRIEELTRTSESDTQVFYSYFFSVLMHY